MDADIVVLILSCKGQPWDSLAEGIRETWCKPVNGIATLFYYGGAAKPYLDGDRLFLSADESEASMARRAIEAFAWVLGNFPNVRYVFRTNESSYVRLDKLRELVQQFPPTRVYSGIIGKDCHGVRFASGAGYFLSKDLVKFLVDNLDKLDPAFADEVCIGEFLARQEVPIIPAPRLDIVSLEHLGRITRKDIEPHFHFRCKQEDNMFNAVKVFKRLHQLCEEDK
jgi:hypothetical protein